MVALCDGGGELGLGAGVGVDAADGGGEVEQLG